MEEGPAGRRGLASFCMGSGEADGGARASGDPHAEDFYLFPLIEPAPAKGGRPLAGGWKRFRRLSLLKRRAVGAARLDVSADCLLRWLDRAPQDLASRLHRQFEALTAPRAAWVGLSLDRPRVMGIVNVTPDSFSDGGRPGGTAGAIAHGEALAAAGADILDIGGESTRPGSSPVPLAEELRRVLLVVETLARCGHRVSVDTRNPTVMAAVLEAGAAIINDVAGLEAPGALDAAARGRQGEASPVVLMHMQGEPHSMQAAPSYRAAALDVFDYLETRIAAAAGAGIPRDRVLVDPGIGFGKALDHNLDILRHLALYHATGCAILLGVSRKGFISKVAGEAGAGERLGGSLAGVLAGFEAGLQVFRVHDVAETRQALAIAQALTVFEQDKENA